MVASKVRALNVEDESWRHYLARCAEGDHSAFAALYDESRRLIYYLILRIVRNSEDAEEVASDVYTVVWNRAHSFDGSRGDVRAWLCMLARNRAIDRIRSNARRHRHERGARSLDFASLEISPEGQAINLERSEYLVTALTILAPEEQELLVLAFFGERTHRELANLVQLPLGTVKTRIRSAMIKLRNRLNASPCSPPHLRNPIQGTMPRFHLKLSPSKKSQPAFPFRHLLPAP